MRKDGKELKGGMRLSDLPIIGITMGDPAGIGPEIIAKSFNNHRIQKMCRAVVIGDASTMEKAKKVVNGTFSINPITSIREAIFDEYTLNVYQLDGINTENITYGEISHEAGEVSFQAVKKVIELALNHELDATVTAPINKKAMNDAGYHYNGHTEIFGELTNSKNYTMMLAHGNLRVVHVSTHVSLREACDLVKKDRVFNTIHLAYKAMKAYGFKNPKIAVAGLNPHASENGLFGHEEEREIIPAIEKAKKFGYNVEGPLPSDTIFSKAKGGFYDVVIAMYHDQGHIPLKMTGFIWDEVNNRWNSVSGVNITLGLPIIRTSVDHGTAFDQAGKGTASADSIINAVEYAVRLSTSKSDIIVK